MRADVLLGGATHRGSPGHRSAARGPVPRAVFVVGFLLPYVTFEPAPVDVLLFVLTTGLLAFGRITANRKHTMLGLSYIALSVVGWSVGEFTMTVPTSFAVRSLAIDAYLVVSFVLLIGVLRQIPGASVQLLRGYIVGAVVVSCLITVIVAVDLDLFDVYRRMGDYRLRGTFKDPNVLGPYLIFPTIALLFLPRDAAFRPLPRLFAVPCLFVLWATYSRGAYVAMAIAVTTVVILHLRSTASRTKSRWLAGTLIVLALTMTAALVMSPSDDLEEIGRGRLQMQAYDSDRFATLERSASFAVEHPLGVGPGTFGQMFGTNPHNLFLGKAVDAGLLAALMVVIVFVRSIRCSLRSARLHSDPWSALIAASLIGQAALSTVIYSHHWRHLLLLIALAWGRQWDLRRGAMVAVHSERAGLHRVGVAV